MEEIIAKGAESVIYRTKFFSLDAVAKDRIPKGYRHKEIDLELRAARTKAEAKLMHAARIAGVSVPLIYDVEEFKIVMEYIDAKNLKNRITSMDLEEKIEVLGMIGENVARLHRNNIVHGDLTTSNMILHSGKLYFIDFSLGEKTASIEAKGVDLHLLQEAFLSAHAENFEMFDVILKAYARNYTDAPAVIARMYEIALRGRGHSKESRRKN
ncbi:MAG: KEOPS complex kinase/ATPase Bud32 [Thermoplasmata archaeon]